ncbi:molybdopterin-guanine dinucleotide biosynthesis protein B [Anaerobacillus alkaliphilus]|uniref:Molybdopterin-guanine dinucleotide biosynthesis protein B n=1 Tax=Anaerobacillus alkaliphilus TaxID=1548597 RepID=A0A4Q0VPV6_9BACI|nr:molybdopterin-guanine dinucleotide biosynthesis protein B [Anaerobacillus alkaliphilus]RXI98288.1 molybdopterin-guanine dinucleotide biosynthesis protein B [Anaerobacillus alkaliphilus]
MKIIQIVGFSNSGKTTLVEKLVSHSTQHSLRVGTIKHHGHGGELRSQDEGKDSWRHRQAGALISSAVSKGVLQLNVLQEKEWAPDELLKLYLNFPIDVVIVEGFKQSPYQKVVLIKKSSDIQLLSTLENIICVISWIPLDDDVKQKLDIVYYQLEDESNYINFLLQKLKG